MTGVRVIPLPPARKWRVARYISGRLESPQSPSMTTIMHEGFRMHLDLSESYERTMYYSGLYNPWLTLIFRHLLRSGDTVVDGGANIGYFSLLAGMCVGLKGHVHAFEPIPRSYQALLTNLNLNSAPQIRANLSALSSDERELQFYLPADVKTGRPLGRLATAVVHKTDEHLCARSTTLDAYAAASGLQHVRLIKLDVEGSEVAALEGMRHLLSEQRIDYLVCELNTTLLDTSGIPRSAVRDTVSEFGYRAFYIHTSGGFKRRARVHFIPVSEMANPDIYGDYLLVAPSVRVPPW